MSKDENKENDRIKQVLYKNLDLFLEKIETQNKSIEELEFKLQGGGVSGKKREGY